MNHRAIHTVLRTFSILLLSCLATQRPACAQETSKAFIDGSGPGWKPLTVDYFVNVNCRPDTWTWTNGITHCTGKPVGVIRSSMLHTNFEMVAQWRHLQAGGNSGIFLWATPESIQALEAGKGRLPTGIEVQVLDHGY